MALLVALVVGVIARGAERPLRAYDRVDVAPAKTSIYLGSVSMTMPAFARTGSVYEAGYVANVFPFFFYNETGRISIDISDEMLRRLERGEPIEFSGRGVRDDGEVRRVEGRATPLDAASGKLKVRVFYSKRIELILNTTYRFPDAKPFPATAALLRGNFALPTNAMNNLPIGAAAPPAAVFERIRGEGAASP